MLINTISEEIQPKVSLRRATNQKLTQSQISSKTATID